MSLPEQDNNSSRLVHTPLDSVADHKIRHRPSSNHPFNPLVFSPRRHDKRQHHQGLGSGERVVTRGTYNLMLKSLSHCLLQERVRSFEL
jgi:hypothetical protein